MIDCSCSRHASQSHTEASGDVLTQKLVQAKCRNVAAAFPFHRKSYCLHSILIRGEGSFSVTCKGESSARPLVVPGGHALVAWIPARLKITRPFLKAHIPSRMCHLCYETWVSTPPPNKKKANVCVSERPSASHWWCVISVSRQKLRHLF